VTNEGKEGGLEAKERIRKASGRRKRRRRKEEGEKK